MKTARLPLFIAFAALTGLVAVQPQIHGQDKLDAAALNKLKTKELLDKANEEYRVFFKKPETGIEFWSAIKFEMDLGKFDLAALHMKLLLEKEEKDTAADLVKLEDAEGMSAFLRLRSVRQWSEHKPFHDEATKNVEVLIDRVTKAVETHLSDPVRIKKYIQQLDARTPEERGYAYVQIARSKERAVPYLVEALRTNFGKSLFPRLRETLLRMDPETVPVYLEVFKATDKDYGDLELRLTMLDIIQQRDDKRVVPYLWHMSAYKKYPEAVRKKAKEVLASLLRMDMSDLPPARESLVQLAEKYYQHKVPFAQDKDVKIWEWTGEAIELQPVKLSPYAAEEFYGMRYATEALELDPSYQPAQIVFLSLMLERAYKPKVDQILSKPLPPNLQKLLTTADIDLLMSVMERAMEERQLPVVLPIIQALGERGDFRTARASSGDQPRGVVRGLYYPDRRVQFASFLAMLRMPPSTAPAVASDRVVELARRFLASEMTAKALVAYAPAGGKPAARQIVKDLGYEAVIVDSATDAVKTVKAAADIDLAILHRGVSDKEFSFVYSQLRRDADLGGLPLIVVVDKNREKAVKKFVARDRGVIVVVEDRFKADDDLKTLVEAHVKSVQFAKLTPGERKMFAFVSMDALWRMAKGDLQGYDVTPALDVIKLQVRSPEMALPALEILGRMPGKQIQLQLAGLVADPGSDIKAMRMPALIELNRHLQKNGVQLDKVRIDDLKKTAKEVPAVDDTRDFRAQLNVTLSMISRTSGTKTGGDLLKFRPDPPPAPPKEKEK